MSGSQFRSLAEFADQAAQGEAGALRETALGQQDLQVKQLLGALQAGVGAQGVGAQRLAAFTNLGGDVARSGALNLASQLGLQGDLAKSLLGVEQTAVQRLGVGSEISGRALQQALGRLDTGTRLGLGVEGQVSENVRDAIAALTGLGTEQLGGLGRAGEFENLAARRAELGSTQRTQGARTFADLLGQTTSRGGQRATSQVASLDSLTRLLGGNRDAAVSLLGLLNQQGGSWVDYARTGLGERGASARSLAESQARPNPWAVLGRDILKEAGGAVATGASGMVLPAKK
jgi:hypothetical protein